MLCQRLGGDPQFAQQCFQKCETLCFQPGKDALWSIGLASLADRIAARLHSGSPKTEALEKRFCRRCAEAEALAQVSELRSLYHDWVRAGAAGLQGPEKRQFYQSVSDRGGSEPRTAGTRSAAEQRR